jgi:DNA repair protein SbcC/Rad50
MSRYISKVEITNFQSHEHSVMELTPGINLFTGTSNAGKSAINRAIYWALSNKPRGDYFIRHGKDSVRVKLIYDDGSELIRYRGADKNFVKIKHANGKTESYTKFGAEYPEPVKKFLSIPRENDILGNIYYSDQMSPLFLVDLPTADLPRAIGYLAGSDVMESASKSMMQESRQVKRDIDKIQSEIKKTENELKKYSQLDEKLLCLEKCKKMQSGIQGLIANQEYIQELDTRRKNTVNKINELKVCIYKLNDLLKYASEINMAKEKYAIRAEMLSMVDSSSNIHTVIDNVQAKIGKLNAFFKSYQKRNLKDLKNKLELTKKFEQIYSEYVSRTKSIQTIQEHLKNINNEAKEGAKIIKQYKKELLEANYICKTCGQKLVK